MPFTFAHPAIVLPFAKIYHRYFSLTALIIGSMVPDFEYFIRMKIHSAHSHTLGGILYFDLPVGLLLYLIYVPFVRVPFIIHLPKYLRERFSLNFIEKNILVIILSIFTGAVSHLFWDSFTHASGYAVRHFSLLSRSLMFGDISLPLFKLLQHGSTAVGIFIICYAIWTMPRKAFMLTSVFYYYWIIVGATLLLVIVTKYFASHVIGPGDAVATMITGAFVGIFVSSIIYRVRVRDTVME